MHRIIHSVIPRLVICIAFILSGSSEAFTTSPHKNNKWGCHPQTTNTEHHPLRYLQPVELATITTSHSSYNSGVYILTSTRLLNQRSSDNEDENEENAEDNPYQDPNYPDLEFVNYSDPEYRVDQGITDEYFDNTSTEVQIEAMREERRLKNDEFQFETYYKDILKEGEDFKGEWTVFKTSTFAKDNGENDAVKNGGSPRLAKVAGPFKVISRGERIHDGTSPSLPSESGGENRLEHERLLHHEKIFKDPDVTKEDKKRTTEWAEQEEISMNTKFWPDELSSNDFRGEQGIMCVGNAYTICTATPMELSQTINEGPFSSYRAELGILSDALRLRIKLDYNVLDEMKDDTKGAPPLHLKTLTICRETLGMWPRAENYKSAIEAVTQSAFFGKRGAEGGLYDPPPVGCEEQSNQYLLLDLEGQATVLLPYCIDQNPNAFDGNGWVTTLDWTPGKNRYQLDRKMTSGINILGLRTLELSTVQGVDAATYRPSDGGENMRQ